MLPKTLRQGFSVVAAAAFALGLGQIAEAAECKGLESAQCEATDGCSWVDPYKRADGVQVSGHCRKKAGKKTATEPSEPAKSSEPAVTPPQN